MKKMGAFLFFLGLALVLCAFWLRQYSSRAGAIEGGQSRPMNRWQQGVTLDLNPDYSSWKTPKRDVPAKVSAEAQRPRPEERRN